MALIFTTDMNPSEERSVQRRHQDGKLLRLARGIYSDELHFTPQRIVERNAIAIAAHAFPGAVLGGRTGVTPSVYTTEIDGAVLGYLFLTDPDKKRGRPLILPGLEIRPAPGPGPLPGDTPYLGLYLPSRARKFLENLRPSRSIAGAPTRTLGRTEVERLLERLCGTAGEEALNQLRDEARQIAGQLEAEAELMQLDGIIGALLRTRTTKLTAPTAKARSAGRAYDPNCLARLTILMQHLQEIKLPRLKDAATDSRARRVIDFIEAYFSNFIEGTRFPIEEAREMTFNNAPAPGRPQDSHDILATFAQLEGLTNPAPTTISSKEFLNEIRERHASLMSARPELHPGQWKTRINIAGNTTFVAPNYVPGTLEAGIDLLPALDHPFARAIYIHFLLTDVHPFNDGNGRISRIMMTKYLTGSGLSRVVIPTVFRDDYLGVLRKMSIQNDPHGFVNALTKAQSVTAACAEGEVTKAITLWASTYAFVEAGANARLELPDLERKISWRNGIPAPLNYWEAELKPDAFAEMFQRREKSPDETPAEDDDSSPTP